MDNMGLFQVISPQTKMSYELTYRWGPTLQTPKNFYVIMMVKRFRIPNYHKMNPSKRQTRGLDLQKLDTGRMLMADPVGFSQEKKKETKKQQKGNTRNTKETKANKQRHKKKNTHTKNTQISTNLHPRPLLPLPHGIPDQRVAGATVTTVIAYWNLDQRRYSTRWAP